MDKIKLTLVMLIWGSIGIFTKYIDLSPILLSFFRAIISLPVLMIIIKMNRCKIKVNFKDARIFMLSGVMIGLAWAALFFGYKNTSISSAIIIYNMCPIYVMIAGVYFLKEKLNYLQVGIIGISFLGLFFILGTIDINDAQAFGMALSGVSGILYACIVIINKKTTVKMDHTMATFIQMISAAVVLIPFVILEGEVSSILDLDIQGGLLVVILGLVHTGIAYNLYFSTYQKMKSIDIVAYSYLEPVFGIILSVFIMGEIMTSSQVLGTVMILGATYIGEYVKAKKNLRDT